MYDHDVMQMSLPCILYCMYLCLSMHIYIYNMSQGGLSLHRVYSIYMSPNFSNSNLLLQLIPDRRLLWMAAFTLLVVSMIPDTELHIGEPQLTLTDKLMLHN